MKQMFNWKKAPLLLIALGLVMTFAFAQSHSGTQKGAGTDTIPAREKKIRDLDEALAEIDRGEREMQKAFKEIDHAKIEQEIRLAMKNLDMKKMEEDLAKVMKEIDMQKINLEVQKALKEVDSEKLQKEIAASMAKVDMEKVKAELEAAKVEMQRVKEIDFKKVQEELAAIQPEMEKAMKEAKEDIEKARKEITDYKNLVTALEKDGYLKKGSTYKIEYRNNELSVNGKKLPAEATKKYRSYIGDKKAFTLEKNEDGLEIDKNKN